MPLYNDKRGERATRDRIQVCALYDESKTVAELFGYGRGFGLPSHTDCEEVRRLMSVNVVAPSAG